MVLVESADLAGCYVRVHDVEGCKRDDLQTDGNIRRRRQRLQRRLKLQDRVEHCMYEDCHWTVRRAAVSFPSIYVFSVRRATPCRSYVTHKLISI